MITAVEASALTKKHGIQNLLTNIFDQITIEAKEGKTTLVFSTQNLDEVTLDVLRAKILEQGFYILNVVGDTLWYIKWGKEENK